MEVKAPSVPIKRACDACHRRKVRCTGGQPCRNCGQSSLDCTYNAIPQKKGPKGSRAKVITELRETQCKPAPAPSKVVQSPLPTDFDPSSMGMGPVRNPNLLTKETIEECLEFFFRSLYPTMPILQRERFRTKIDEMDSSIESYCLVASLCAFVLIQSNMHWGLSLRRFKASSPVTAINGNTTLGAAVLDEVLRTRKQHSFLEAPNVNNVITAFFLFGCYFGLDKHNTAWYYLREATTLAQIIGLQDEATYLSLDAIDATRVRRLFWLLFVTERAYALQRHRPLTLHATIALPQLDDDPADSETIPGFIHLVNLFRPFDDTFVGLWNKARSDCSTAWLAQLQQQLSDALPESLAGTAESQAADLRTSQQWLRTMVWQLSIDNGYLSSTSSDASMTFRYPVDIARDLAADTSQFSKQSMEVHGLGLIEKLFDVACTLTDVIACVPGSSFEFGPKDYLHQLLQVISTLRGGETRFLPLLLAKVSEALPVMAAPIPRIPDPVVKEEAEEIDDTQLDLAPTASALAARDLAPISVQTTVTDYGILPYTPISPVPLNGLNGVPGINGVNGHHIAMGMQSPIATTGPQEPSYQYLG